MSLYSEWNDLISNQTNDSIDEFWAEYCEGEQKIYSDYLDKFIAGETVLSGRVGELAEKYEIRPVIFMGFLDGAQQSVKEPFDIKDMDEDSEFSLEFDIERLFFNMLKADADHLYGLEQWEQILGEDRMKEIAREYKKSKTVVKKKRPGRNDPCWCGSGKKYKHCHMRSDEEEDRKNGL
ncbi:MAG: SEC-C metal-binding domain-containing protein [Anaerovoracaceae bacterium]|jgi:hypothetical protein